MFQVLVVAIVLSVAKDTDQDSRLAIRVIATSTITANVDVVIISAGRSKTSVGTAGKFKS